MKTDKQLFTKADAVVLYLENYKGTVLSDVHIDQIKVLVKELKVGIKQSKNSS